MKKISLFFVLVIMLFATPQTNALIIDIAPGSSPAGGYLSLSLFSVSPIAGVGDDTIVNMNVPSFSYAGQSWNRVGIVSNGYLVIGGGTDADVNALNDSFPNTAAPNNILAPFWTNLNPEAGGAIRIATLTDGTNNWIVVDWAEVPNFNTAAGLQYNSFEAWLRTGSVEDITFTYGVVTGGNSGLLTVGAEDITGTVGTNYYFNGAGILPLEGTELRVTSSGPPVSDVPEPATMLLLGLGLMGLAGARRFKKKK